jgi:hypothetical protein
MMELVVPLIHIIGASRNNPSILVLVALVLVVALRHEIGDWIGRRFFGLRRH